MVIMKASKEEFKDVCILNGTGKVIYRCKAMENLRPEIWGYVANMATYCPCCGVKIK